MKLFKHKKLIVKYIYTNLNFQADVLKLLTYIRTNMDPLPGSELDKLRRKVFNSGSKRLAVESKLINRLKL